VNSDKWLERLCWTLASGLMLALVWGLSIRGGSGRHHAYETCGKDAHITCGSDFDGYAMGRVELGAMGHDAVLRFKKAPNGSPTVLVVPAGTCTIESGVWAANGDVQAAR
jgi:hypothetical protein